uniref:Phorbol-ester/DAG-type domain-containing protein n=1 Tax=Fagus sylvatica TaxID=28930 RepID=A0A2N9J505_FAGSY
MEAKVHNHPLTLLWKQITFSCDLCGKEGKGVPYLCGPCGFCIHISCVAYLRKVKVVRHKHPLDLIHYLEVLQSDSRFCQLCVRKVDTNYGLYYCSRCDFVVHLDCANDKRNIEELNMLELKDEEFTEPKTMLGNEDSNLDESVDSATYKVIKTDVGKDEIKIATKIRHFSHEHDLKLIDEVHNNKKCNGCRRAILPPFYSCIKCSFFLHKSCVELPKKKRHPLHRHPLTLLPQAPLMRKFFWCDSCNYPCNGFTYGCESCRFYLDVQCGLVSDILTHKGHEHRLFLAITSDKQSCNGCGSKKNEVFRCTTCEFALDFKCATLPLATRYEKHEHPFTLSYTAEDDSGEYYCDICEEERDPNHWFYYCAECSYPAHPKCIIGKSPNCKFGVTYKFNSHPHPLTFVEETKDHPPCPYCRRPCEELFYQCTQCNFNLHGNEWCLQKPT